MCIFIVYIIDEYADNKSQSNVKKVTGSSSTTRTVWTARRMSTGYGEGSEEEEVEGGGVR